MKSIGVYSVNVADVNEVGLDAVDDSQVDDGEERPPGHAFIDYKGVTGTKQKKRRASLLRDKAEEHGWRHRPTA
ncbi:hypothetical protein [Streptomyces olivaceus]|uniref:hypothetical protein n=1 Tax=Streptomyces olivaceus TaxID=47716 RepID=UPI0036E645A7